MIFNIQSSVQSFEWIEWRSSLTGSGDQNKQQTVNVETIGLKAISTI